LAADATGLLTYTNGRDALTRHVKEDEKSGLATPEIAGRRCCHKQHSSACHITCCTMAVVFVGITANAGGCSDAATQLPATDSGFILMEAI
jgi:hypothetical protein